MADSDQGYGQLDPVNTGSPFTAASFLVEQMLGRLSTMKVVVIKAVDTGAKTVDVQPMVSQTDGRDNVTEHGTIFGLPYLILQYGKNAFLADPVVDDIGLMVVADRDISAVKSTKKVGPPGSSRQMDASDGVYLGGILNGDPEQWVKFTDTGIEIKDKNSNAITTGDAGININGVVFNRQGQIAGNLPVTGGLQLGGVIANVDGSPYSNTIQTAGDIVGGAVKEGSIRLGTHHHTAQGATAATTGPQP
jgi:hypothetical protein